MTFELIFPELATNFSTTLSSLKRATLSIHNRLNSILDDSNFVCAVSDAYGLPLVANERCGSWYIPPDRKGGSAYFKSTDGHMGQWSFSNRRLNLQILDILQSKNGCVIVDSTRRGKCKLDLIPFKEEMLMNTAMPDALSKTIPIWCTVVNRVLFPDLTDAHELHVPPSVVSDSEKSQIESRLNGFVQQLKDLDIDLSAYKLKMEKPIRPIWNTRDSILPHEQPIFDKFHPVVLCTASRRVNGAEMSEGGYIQGAGDDSEGWSHGLTPVIFWKHQQELLRTLESDLPLLIASLVEHENKSSSIMSFTRIEACPQLHVGRIDMLMSQEIKAGDAVVWCDADFESLHGANIHREQKTESLFLKGSYYLPFLHLCTPVGKLGARALRTELMKLISFFQSLKIVRNVYVCCPDGRDISIGVSLAILCLFSSAEVSKQVPETTSQSDKVPLQKPAKKLQSVIQILNNDDTGKAIDKQYIRQELAKIMLSIPNANPSRTTLQSVNTFVFAVARNLITIPKSYIVSRACPITIKDLFFALPGQYRFGRTVKSVQKSGAEAKSVEETAGEARIEVSPDERTLLCHDIGSFTHIFSESDHTFFFALERYNVDSGPAAATTSEEYCIAVFREQELLLRLWIDEQADFGSLKTVTSCKGTTFSEGKGHVFHSIWRFSYMVSAVGPHIQGFSVISKMLGQEEKFWVDTKYKKTNA